MRALVRTGVMVEGLAPVEDGVRAVCAPPAGAAASAAPLAAAGVQAAGAHASDSVSGWIGAGWGERGGVGVRESSKADRSPAPLLTHGSRNRVGPLPAQRGGRTAVEDAGHEGLVVLVDGHAVHHPLLHRLLRLCAAAGGGEGVRVREGVSDGLVPRLGGEGRQGAVVKVSGRVKG